MKVNHSLFILFSLFLLSSNLKGSAEKTLASSIKKGDILFHTSTSSQSKAIQAATGSKYSHMGIIYKQGDKYSIYEAVQPVKLTPLDKSIARGE